MTSVKTSALYFEGPHGDFLFHSRNAPPLLPSGLRAGDEVLAVNGATVSGLDLDLMQSLFSHQKLQLLLRRDRPPGPEEPALAAWPHPSDACLPPAPLDLQVWTSSPRSGLEKSLFKSRADRK